VLKLRAVVAGQGAPVRAAAFIAAVLAEPDVREGAALRYRPFAALAPLVVNATHRFEK
jgi:hypothetical protein